MIIHFDILVCLISVEYFNKIPVVPCVGFFVMQLFGHTGVYRWPIFYRISYTLGIVNKFLLWQILNIYYQKYFFYYPNTLNAIFSHLTGMIDNCTIPLLGIKNEYYTPFHSSSLPVFGVGAKLYFAVIISWDVIKSFLDD